MAKLGLNTNIWADLSVAKSNSVSADQKTFVLLVLGELEEMLILQI